MSQVAKNRYLFGGQATIPVTYRALFMYQGNNAAQHSDRPHSMLMNMPGIKIAAPSTPADAKGLLAGAIRADDPVVVFEDRALWPSRAPVPQGEYVIPFGVADIKRRGHDVTVVAIAATVRAALDAAEELDRDGISVEVIDPRTLVPLDWATILRSVEKTGHLVVVDLANRTCSAASEIAATVAEEGFDSLAAAPVRVTAPDTHIPFSSALLRDLFPSTESIVRAVRRVLD
jgi:pyruvate dehydrogenase E1 component beta subunit